MPRYKEVYEKKAHDYHALVSKEDWQGNLPKALRELAPFRGKRIIEFGAGTGRLTALLAQEAGQVYAFDAYPAMIEFGAAHLNAPNVSWGVAENKSIPMQDASADLAVAGWTFGHCTSWYPETWEVEISAAVSEMLRVTDPAGTLVIIETLGTGKDVPAPPNEKLALYYRMLESRFGFSRTWVRTDYRFADRAEAEKLAGTFFGRSFDFVQDALGSAMLPECTGLWIRRTASTQY